MRKRAYGEGSVYPRKDGRWVAAVSLEDGKRKYITPATHSNVEAVFQSEHMQGCFGLHLSGDGKYDKKEVSGYLFKLEDEPLVNSDFNRPDDRVFGQVHPFVFLNFCESSQLLSFIK